jgi:hypothetical protein
MKLSIKMEDISPAEFEQFRRFYDSIHGVVSDVRNDPVSTSNVGDNSDNDDTASVVNAESTLDSDGMPWDERIHAGSKTVNADGRWKRRKGVDDALYMTVVAEHKGSIGIASGCDNSSVADSTILMTFPEFIKRLTETKAAGTLTDTHVASVMAGNGLVTPMQLSQRPDLLLKVAGELWPQ